MNWFTVEEKLPQYGDLCLVMNDLGNFFVARYMPDEKGQYQIKDWRFTICPCCDETGKITTWCLITKD